MTREGYTPHIYTEEETHPVARPRLTPEQLTRLPALPQGWADDDDKRNKVLALLREAEAHNRIVPQRDLARAIGVSNFLMSHSMRNWTDLKQAQEGAQAAFIAVLEYFAWAKKNPKEAFEMRDKSLPQTQEEIQREAMRRPARDAHETSQTHDAPLSTRQIRIGNAAMKELALMAAEPNPANIDGKIFAGRVARAAGVTLSTLSSELAKISKGNGMSRLIEMLRAQDTKKEGGEEV